MDGNGRTWPDRAIAGNFWESWKYLEMARNYWKFLDIPGYGKKWLKMAENG